jgi:peroxiredoxin
MAARRPSNLPDPGSPAPGFYMPFLSGGKSSLAELCANGPLLLAFFKVSCPVCQLTLPFLERIHATGSLAVYGVSQNDTEATLEFNQEFGISFPILLDSEDLSFPVSNAYGISSVPTMFLIQSDGMIARVMEGWRKSEYEWLAALAGTVPFREGDRVPEWKAG